MVFSIGAENEDNESKIYLKYSNKNYGRILSKFFNHNFGPKEVSIETSYSKSPFLSKYTLIFNNLIFFSLADKIWDVDFELSSKKSESKFVSFDLSPIFKLKFTNNDLPLQLMLKYGHYEASRSQRNFDKYDYTSMIPSLMPNNLISFTVSHWNNLVQNAWNNDLHIQYKIKANILQIIDFEKALKLHGNLRMIYELPVQDHFKFAFNNLILLNKSFILSSGIKKKHAVENKNHYKTLFDCNSKVLSMNLLSQENKIDNGSDFYIQNHFILKLKEIKLLQGNDLSSRIEPFFGIETIFTPNKQNSIKNCFQIYFNTGISLSLNQMLSLNFSLYTFAFNSKMDKNLINKFRINIDF